MSFINPVIRHFQQETSVINLAHRSQMLINLLSEVHELVCTDEVDETAGTHKWNKKAAEQLEKLNNDCNRTAGLEAKLSLAVGAWVMLRCIINTKCGLVNGLLELFFPLHQTM